MPGDTKVVLSRQLQLKKYIVMIDQTELGRPGEC